MINLLLVAANVSAGEETMDSVSPFDDPASKKDLELRRIPEGTATTARIGLHANTTLAQGRRKLYHLHVSEAGEPCDRNPLWEKQPNPANYKFGCQEIERMLSGEMTLIGTGRVRTVHMVEYEGEAVVVKTLQHVEELRRLKAHLEMHRVESLTLEALRGHPNVVGMLGFCNTTVVTEYHPDNFLHTIFRKKEKLSLRRVVSLALDVAQGMQALHEIAGAIHLDMKPQQLLIDDAGRGKVNDFNSVHLMSADASADGKHCPILTGRPARLVPWRAPENIAGKPVTEKVDIYAMGMIYYSLVSGGLPFPDVETFDEARAAHERPEIDPSWHKGFVEIIQDMWHEDPDERPFARQVVQRLQALQDELLV
ncbi:serine/threonine protein kinase [Ectocarpus siliculosus]|uniref:Serine/threonine protein kinase n=1 Tax=Ectocarpus siliculosus TaxID=2880 RepID=D7FNX1_ECTSI|nr:serine/threonine protein kinase [Ectocarpus siliculosus]|eukprot:CBJ30240.1 serine/threonine protein kinase [Ectocarpus siliculosus]